MDKKLISGILISTVAGMTVWFFTQSDHSPFSDPNVELTDLSMPERIVAGEAFQVSFRASNKRNKTERDCKGFVMIYERKRNPSATSFPSCRTQNPPFYLGTLSSSSTQILVDCEVPKAGSYQMIHGINCRSGPSSKWQMDHQSYIEVDEP